jgi:hypothetical protein
MSPVGVAYAGASGLDHPEGTIGMVDGVTFPLRSAYILWAIFIWKGGCVVIL